MITEVIYIYSHLKASEDITSSVKYSNTLPQHVEVISLISKNIAIYSPVRRTSLEKLFA